MYCPCRVYIVHTYWSTNKQTQNPLHTHCYCNYKQLIGNNYIAFLADSLLSMLTEYAP